MSNTTLYRKYRPTSFKELIGQDHIVQVLQNEIKEGKVAHAYLFSGSRGTGKTSVARIIAQELGTTSNDLYEIDAASNRGIDNIREIRDSVSTQPFDSKYKVYIIDEAHMLTKEAFNALLKTLEEPPPYVIFMLATTEIEKLPETIVSRCETFQFKQPSQIVLKEVVLKTAKKEGFVLDQVSAELIALLGNGSFRDTYGILQKVMNASLDKTITPEEVEVITGAPKGELINDLIKAIGTKDREVGLTAISRAFENNVDAKTFLLLLTQKLRYALFLRHGTGEAMVKSNVSEDDFIFLNTFAKQKDMAINSKTLLSILEAYTYVGLSPIPQLPIELAFLACVGEGE